MPSKNTGKTILKIKTTKKNLTISFTDRSKIKVALEVSANFYLYEGKTLTRKEINQIIEFSNTAELMKYALSLLKKGHYSEWKMREKLYLKEASKKDVDLIIKRLKEHDLINDKMLILDTIEYGNERNIGKNKIIQDLLNKGFFMENIAKFNFPYSLEKKKALNNLPKLERKYDKYPFEQKKQHIFKALLSLGFDNDVALEVLSHIKEPKQKEENNKLERDFDKTLIRYKNKYDGYELKNKTINYLHSKGYKLNDIMKMWEKKYGEID